MVEALEQIQDWWIKLKAKGAKTILCEEIVYSITWNVAGRPDHVIRVGDRCIVVDYKSTNANPDYAPQGVYWENLLQLALYAIGLEEMGNLEIPKIDDGWIVSGRKDGGADIVKASVVLAQIDWTFNDLKHWAFTAMSYHLGLKSMADVLKKGV